MAKNDLLAGADLDEELKITVNKDYASKYKIWREKEVLQKLKDRYGQDTYSSESSSSEDDDDAKDLPNLEKGFFKTLSLLKEKDPRIYSENYKYPVLEVQENSKKISKEKPLFLRDYERQLIVEKEGKLSDDEYTAENPRASSPTYVEEQKTLKESFKQALKNSDDEDEDLGSMFKKKTKTTAELEQEEEDYKKWLKGQKEEIKDKETESDLKGLHDYWNDPKLNPDEVYLRDYILNKRFLEPEDDFKPEFNDIDDEDVEQVVKQEQFERRYNFRFEEADQEYIKRYPRTMEMSLRRKDDRRKRKRQEIHERKEAEKRAKHEEIKQLKALKRKEIMEKIEKIKEVTGNDIDFNDYDLDEEFDPKKHDQKMQELFDNDFYEVAEDHKPEFDDVDNFLEIENWESWKRTEDGEHESRQNLGDEQWQGALDCEDPSFNMDCDYDPRAQLQEELIRGSKSQKKQRRKSKLALALAREKPIFDPKSEKFEDYFDEYYKLDCEDIIGDLPCRFKYRQTVPNDYGLTVDEILRADVKELNQWCSLKKVLKYKPEHVEKNESKAYKTRAKNEALKRKILPSLYQNVSEEESKNVLNEMGKGKKKKKKNKSFEEIKGDAEEPQRLEESSGQGSQNTKRKMKRKHNEISHDASTNESLINENAREGDSNQEGQNEHNIRKKKKKKSGVSPNLPMNESFNHELFNGKVIQEKSNDINTITLNKKKKKKQKSSHNLSTQSSGKFNESNSVGKKEKRFKRPEPNIPLSDVRLKAYGIHPKKFKNKIKYGNKQDGKCW